MVQIVTMNELLYKKKKKETVQCELDGFNYSINVYLL